MNEELFRYAGEAATLVKAPSPRELAAEPTEGVPDEKRKKQVMLPPGPICFLQPTEGDKGLLGYNGKNITLAKNLRRSATPQEKHLWYDFLSKYKVRFQRQKAIGGFIADFYCHKARLVVEIDGSQHYTPEGRKKDEFRTEMLVGYDLRVIRFTNLQIDNNFRNVCGYIDAVVTGILTGGDGSAIR